MGRDDTATIDMFPLEREQTATSTNRSSFFGRDFTIPPLVNPSADDARENAIVANDAFDNDVATGRQTPYPARIHSALYTRLRWGIFTIYRRLFTLVFFANAVAFIIVMSRDRKLTDVINAAAVNLLGVALARHPVVINSLFLVLCSLPRSTPLRLRRLASKVFHYGGVHSGCGVACVVWYIGFIGLISRDYSTNSSSHFSSTLLALAYVIMILLLAIVIFAFPALRFKSHDLFEFSHRFSGWIAIALFWPLFFIYADNGRHATHQSLGGFLASLPAFWIILFLTCTLIWPWLYLRKIPIRAEYLSDHAIRLHFLDQPPVRFGRGYAVSRHPLRDWHGFAHFPDLDGKAFSCLVSKVGDWTTECIENPPKYLWRRGIPVTGFGYCMKMFRSIILVTTGSGIGPVLAMMALDDRPAVRIIWQTRTPLKTYGQGILDCVANIDQNPVVIDSDKGGRQDMLPIVLNMVESDNVECVIVVSNPVFTRKMVYELESRGIGAFGPIFDS